MPRSCFKTRHPDGLIQAQLLKDTHLSIDGCGHPPKFVLAAVIGTDQSKYGRSYERQDATKTLKARVSSHGDGTRAIHLVDDDFLSDARPDGHGGFLLLRDVPEHDAGEGSGCLPGF